jgi:hypothetical protein
MHKGIRDEGIKGHVVALDRSRRKNFHRSFWKLELPVSRKRDEPPILPGNLQAAKEEGAGGNCRIGAMRREFGFLRLDGTGGIGWQVQ